MNKKIQKVFDGLCRKYKLQESELQRTYSVDCSEPYALKEIIIVNIDSIQAETIKEIDETLQTGDLLALGVGEEFDYGAGGGIGVTVKRLS